NIIWNISAITGIAQPTLIETSVNLYPNPANEILNVGVTLSQPSKISLRLLTLEGKELYIMKTGNYTKGEHQINIDLNQLKIGAGTCFLQLMINDMLITKEFIRLR
ncbi:MAG: T9SS type A sorting domain-containing protein, partial [Bacteroidota bacterium]